MLILELCNLIKRDLLLLYCENICFIHADCKGLRFELSNHRQQPLLWFIEDSETKHRSPCHGKAMCKDTH